MHFHIIGNEFALANVCVRDAHLTNNLIKHIKYYKFKYNERIICTFPLFSYLCI